MPVQFVTTCEKCEAEVPLYLDEIEGLPRHIENERSEERRAAEREFDGFVDAGALTDGDRPLWELAAAIRRGDRFEAELQLDRIAEELGVDAVEQVQQGRFSPRARTAA